MTIEDVESAAVLCEIGAMSEAERNNIYLEYATQPENPLITRVKQRLKRRAQDKNNYN